MEITIATLDMRTWDRYSQDIMAIEEISYEPARRDSEDFLRRVIEHPRGIGVIALVGEEVAGFCLGGPLEEFPTAGGAQDDPEWNKHTTLYTADLAVSPKYHRHGIGIKLKQRLLELARSKGFRYVAGRMRVGLAEAVINLNTRLGAYEVQRIPNAYADDLEPNECFYYHIDL